MRVWLVFLIALLAIPVSVARATVLVEVPFEEMARDADAIVVGEVTRVGGRLVLRGDSAEPWTAATIRVDRWLAGSGESEIVVQERGGSSPLGTVRILGTPTYEVGERVLLFLRRDDEGRLRTFGMVQGKFEIHTTLSGLDETVTRDLDGVGFARWVQGTMTVSHLPSQTMPLSFVVDRVRLVRQVRAGDTLR